MEAWLTELEIGMVHDSTLINHPYSHHQSEHLTAEVGEDFLYPLSAESNTSSPEWDFDCYSTLEPISSPQCISRINDNNKNTVNNNDNVVPVVSSTVHESKRDPLQLDVTLINKDDNKETSTQQAKNVTAKRKRQPSQVYDHIMAERKRREILTQRFIALSAIVPGLKKMDKTSVLGEAIKYLKQLQEKVQVLEEVTAKRTVQSVVLVKKSQLVVDNDETDDSDSSCIEDNNCASGGDGGDNRHDDSLPEIEVKASEKTLLIRIYCEKQKGILAKLFAEVEKHDLTVVSSNIMTFGSMALDITIVAQMEKGFNKNVKDFVRTIRSSLLASQGP